MKLKIDKKKTLWFRGGMIGMSVCLALFAVYFLTFPLLNGMIPDRVLMIMAFTGHAFVLLSGFYYPEYWVCKPIGRTCGSWNIEQGCTAYNPTYDSLCITIVPWVIFFLFAAVLFCIYFGVGALIGRIVEISIKRTAK